MNMQSAAPVFEASEETPRRPRVALLGEFSAGKSTLANVLFGRAVSPVQVTATQMPPVWYSHGEDALTELCKDGSEREIPSLESVSLADAEALKVSMKAEVLEFCDLIDMPGTSDPNMAMSAWEAMLARVDAVVWCTPAGQAWRQSEAALWDEICCGFEERALLLVTRMDKISDETDRKRILARVRRETDGMFRDVLGISLTDAARAGDDEGALDAAGAGPFVAALMDLIEQCPATSSHGGAMP